MFRKALAKSRDCSRLAHQGLKQHMTINRPYFRIYRPDIGGNYLLAGDSSYPLDQRYASDRTNFVRAYHLLEQDLVRIFEYVEPADANLDTYSHQLYALLLRACTEFESNARAILQSNGYSRSGNWTLTDYYKINSATRLSEYTLTLPMWDGAAGTVKPFDTWNGGSHSLPWYQAYNAVKHDRSGNFPSASLQNVMKAVAAVFATLFSQFHIFAFDPHRVVNSCTQGGHVYSHDKCIWTIEAASLWTPAECYEIDWPKLKGTPSPFDQFSF